MCGGFIRKAPPPPHFIFRALHFEFQKAKAKAASRVESALPIKLIGTNAGWEGGGEGLRLEGDKAAAASLPAWLYKQIITTLLLLLFVLAHTCGRH